MSPENTRMSLPAPLSPWIWCCVWLTLIWLPLYSIDSRIEPAFSKSSNISELDSTHVEIFTIGDSILKYSLPDTAEFDKILGGNNTWNHIWVEGGNWKDFLPKLDTISKKEPSTIIIQDSILLEYEVPNLPARSYQYLKDTIKDYLHIIKTPQITTQRTKPPIIEITPETIMIWNEQVGINYARNQEINKEAVQFLTTLQSISRKIIIIHLPRTDRLHAGKSQDNWMDHLTNTLNNLNIEFITLGNPLLEDQCYDGTHPNEMGQEVRTRQFIELIESLPK